MPETTETNEQISFYQDAQKISQEGWYAKIEILAMTISNLFQTLSELWMIFNDWGPRKCGCILNWQHQVA